MNFQQAEDYIFSYTDYEKVPVPHAAANYDLRRMEELLAGMGNPHLAAKSVHIAGTKGKGSVAAMVASVLSCSGYITGLYTSPHLHTWRERMRVNGILISEEEFVPLVERVKPEVEEVNQKATYGQLTTFELLTALGFSFFEQKEVEFQVLEVGMGGKYDATNVITPEVCIMTSISLDHTEVLGTSPSVIAGEKAGIIKPGSIVVTSPQSGDVMKVIQEVCRSQGAELIRVGIDVTWQEIDFGFSRQSLRVMGRMGDYELTIPLLGRYQLENVTAAVTALEVLVGRGFRISRDNIIDGLAKVDWPGRFHIISRSPLLVVDGAHNPDSARKLKQSLGSYFKVGVKERAEGELCFCERAVLVIGVSADKDIAGIASEFASLFDKVIVTRSRHPRAMAASAVATEFMRYGADVQVTEDVPAALALAMNMAGTTGLVCIAGSLFVVGEAIEEANRRGYSLAKA